MTEEKIKQLSEIDNPICKEVAAFIQELFENPFYDGYVDVKTAIQKIKEADVTVSAKFIPKMKTYYEQLEYFRSKLTAEEAKQANVESNSILDEARTNLKNASKKTEV